MAASPADIIAGLRSRVPGWDAIADADVTLSLLTGGMSNIIYAADVPQSSLADPAAPTRVVARLLSPQLDGVIDRHREMQIVKFLSTTGIGPRLFGSCAFPSRSGGDNNGGGGGGGSSVAPLVMRVEEFVCGRTLVLADLRSSDAIARKMAIKVARLHGQTASLARQMGMGAAPPLPGYADSLHKYLALVGNIEAHPQVARGTARPELLALLKRWARALSQAAERHSGGAFCCALSLISDTSVSPPCCRCDWRAESAWLSGVLARQGGPTVLTHGDLQVGGVGRVATCGAVPRWEYTHSFFARFWHDGGT